MYRNLTPHAIRLRFEDSTVAEPLASDVVLHPENVAVRIVEQRGKIEDIYEFPVVDVKLGEIDGLPEYESGVMLIVSMPVAQVAYALGRRDVVAPDTGDDAVRFTLPNGKEGVYAVRRLRYVH